MDLSVKNEYLRQTYPYLWTAINHHKTHNLRNITFDRYEYLVDLYKDDGDYIIIIKATQCGISEYLIVRAIHNAASGRNIFYALPTYDLVGRFVTNRVNRAIMVVPYYTDLIEKSDVAVATGALLKHIGNGAISFVGSNSPTPFTEFPADDLIIDELDQCNEQNIQMAEERLSASLHKRIIKASNPTTVNYGIDAEWKRSDMKQWYIKCSSCEKWIHPDFFDHVVEKNEFGRYVLRDTEWKEGIDRDILPICNICGRPYDRFAPGVWVSGNENPYISGYHISKMFSTNVFVREIVDRFDRGLSNEFAMQRFYNGDLGEAYTAAGSRLDDAMLNDCISDHGLMNGCKEATIAGIDVGTINYICIGMPEGQGIRLVYAGEVRDFEDIPGIIKRYTVRCFVIDNRPETREATKLTVKARMLKCVGVLCEYSTNKKDLLYNTSWNTISIDRTISLDSLKENLILKKILLPVDIRGVQDFYKQMTASTRIYDEKRDYYNWEERGNPDHYMHAMNYLLLSRRILSQITGA